MVSFLPLFPGHHFLGDMHLNSISTSVKILQYAYAQIEGLFEAHNSGLLVLNVGVKKFGGIMVGTGKVVKRSCFW